MERTISPSRTGVVVLAAGASTRMGTPKQLLLYNGKTLIRRAVDVALASVCEPVVVVLGANAVLVGNELELPVIVTRNTDWETGMSSSVRAGLEALLAADSGVECVVMTLSDQPFVTPALIDQLVQCRRRTGKSIVATDYEGTLGVPALFASQFFPELATLTGDQGARRIIQKHLDYTATVLFTGAAIDVDTPDDYREIQEMGNEQTYEELEIGEEQVSSNECWDVDDAGEIDAPVYPDLNLGAEQVTSNECFDVEEEE